MPLSRPGCPPVRSLFHAPTRYALQALVRFPEDGTYRMARHLAADLGLPGPFLAKILQTLGHAAILESQRGPSGGFRLARPAERITLHDIVLAMEGPEPFEACLLDHTNPGESCHCPIRPAWDDLRHLLTTLLSETSLRDLQTAQACSDRSPDSDDAIASPV